MATAVICAPSAETQSPCPAGQAPSGQLIYIQSEPVVFDHAAAFGLTMQATNTLLGAFLFAYIVAKLVAMVR